MQYPKIHLTMDNSFAAKRWVEPNEWARVIRDLGISCIEASADTEIDPFLCGSEYLDEWLEQVREASREWGVSVVNFYTGYTTYRTLGLAHPDPRIRTRVVDDWLKVMARVAARIRAGLGFYIHAFSERVLQDPAAFSRATDALYGSLAEVARFAGELGPIPVIVEQMYSPHQIPWTVDGTIEYLSEVSRRSGFPAYIAIDTGHQSGQRRFLRPPREAIERGLKGEGPVPYLGSESAYKIFEEASRYRGKVSMDVVASVEEEMDRFPYLFADERDCDLYQWLEKVGCYSPIVHLQQCDGNSSSHLPFIPAYNKTGIVEPLKVLQAIERSYNRPPLHGMPARCADVYLTFEIFPRTTDRPRDILPILAESVRYWRRWVPEDAMSLDDLLARQPDKGRDYR
jgi:sugar phosphate isomerase/epimerase